ncbi:MAG: hypothetical protein HKO98_00515, partial [Gemmatimonadetes bacterium]|nr:hypothetical protein [Gemmatimonadota bacterium]
MDHSGAEHGPVARPLRSLTYRRGPDKRRRRWGAGLGVLLALCGPAASLAAQALPPDEAWRTIDTEHFRVSFPDRLDALGRRAAVIAESALERLEESFIEAPDTRVEILLTDHVDTSNGSASVAPYPRVVVYARPPVEGRALSFHDDWLDLVIVHELAHILHLDRAAGPGGVLRRLFGRVPATWPFFPGSATPRWVIEGLATWYESSLTGSGRIEGSVFDMYLRTAALAGRLERVDQASGETALWPAGQRPYAWGSLFFAWLLDRHGGARMADFVEAVAGQWIPYRLNAAARDAFGTSFSDEWRMWTDSVSVAAREEAGRIATRSELEPVELLTRGARQMRRPRVSPDGSRLAVARADGRSDTGLSIRASGTSGAGEASDQEIGWVRTNGLAAFDWLPDGGLLFSQFEREGPWRLYGDLYHVAPDGRERRLTEGARLDHPSAAPDGGWAAAIRTRAGATDLVRVDLDDGSLRVIAEGSSAVYWADPAVSPDGRWIAAARWTPGSVYQVVVLDAATGVVRVVADDA